MPAAGIILTFFSACKNEKAIDVSGIEPGVVFHRFDSVLFSYSVIDSPDVKSIRQAEGEFFDIFCQRIIRIPAVNDSVIAFNLSRFISDREVKAVYDSMQKVYQDVSQLLVQLDGAFHRYKYYFPGKKAPHIYFFISAFNYAIITADSILGIGLDMFLGSSSMYYPSLGFPRYMYGKLSREYIPVESVKAWYQKEYPPDSVKNELLSQMIYYGKMQYYIDCMVPAAHDTLQTGYTEKQLRWCQENESSIWAFMIEKQMLYNTSVSEYIKFINDGPGTSGFPDEAPAKIGVWIGSRIVESYMIKNESTTLPQLLQMNDAQRILEESKYKPAR